MAISIDTILQRMIVDAENMNPALIGTITQGTETYIRFSVAASAIWGVYKQLDWTVDQIFPSTMSKESLEKFATERGKDVEGLTGAELLSFVLSYLRRPPSGGKITDYERWALEAVSSGSVVELLPSMVSSDQIVIDADAFCDPKNKDSIAFSVSSYNVGESVIVDFGTDKEISGVGIGFTTIRGGEFRVYSSEDSTTWALRSILGTSGWAMDSFDAVSARYWKIALTSIDALENWMTPSLHDIKCHGVEFYTDDGTQEKATFAKCTKNPYGKGTVGILLAPVTLSMKMIETVRDHCEEEGPVAPKEIFVAVQRETTVDVKVHLDGSSSFDDDGFRSDVQKYFAELKAGDMIVTAQITVFAIKHGALPDSVTTRKNGGAWSSAATVVASTDEKFILGTLSVE